ncbi:hypothetical protein BN1263180067 [Stenotrophomonas maltophilia]|nr:hypothetical protein BN1263180067 [Stenotrophomonas maltophilia]
MHGSGKESESVTISTLSHACLSRITDTYPQKLATTVVKAAPNLPPSPCSTDLRVREVVHAIHVPLTARLGPDRTVAGRPRTGRRHHDLQRDPGGHQGLHHHGGGGHQR